MEEVCLNSEPVFDEHECEVKKSNGSGANQLVADDAIPKTEPLCPTVGLEFDSFNEAYDFYNVFGKEQGFGIRVSNSWVRSKGKERYRAKFSCSCAGFKKNRKTSNPRPETRTGCPAMIIVKLSDQNKWRIIDVKLEHNHPLSPQPKRLFWSHKKMILGGKKVQKPEPIMEVHTIKLYPTTAVVSACNENLDIGESEIRNPVDYSEHLELKEGDARAVYNYFCRMKLSHPNFFYLMDLDDEGRLKNVFWADFRSRVAYGHFSDAVAIDTTCLTNKFEVPLISFVGVNHHGHYTLLGCAFIGHESAENFAWILKAWLSCMIGNHPQVIVSDHNKHLRSAVSAVFPRSRHCYCLTYIMQRVPERLGRLKDYEAIKQELDKAVYSSSKIMEFEYAWNNMIIKYDLGQNKWLQTLYEDRQKWVPVYLKDIFFAGISPFNQNETFSPFFEGYVNKYTSFKEFLDKFDLALQRKHMKEAMEDLDSRNSDFELKTRSSFESQLAKVYTKEIFKKCQSEIEGMYSCFHTRQVSVNGPIVTYLVKERVETETSEKEVRTYEVVFETTESDIRCICSLFNFKGYLCRHVLNVLNYNGLEEVPARYILPRWRKDFKSISPLKVGPRNSNVDSPMDRCRDLYKHVVRVVEEGAKSKEHYKVVLQELEELVSKLQ